MSLLDSIKNLFRPAEQSEKLYIVDASYVGDGKRGGRLSPRDQIDILKRLARFSEQESIQMIAVFEGNPLRVVDEKDGGDFSGVRVYFTMKKYDRRELIFKHAKKSIRKADVMVITPDEELERRIADAGGKTMRASTFKKALEHVKVAGGGDRGGGKRNSRRRSRKPRNNREQDGDQRPQQKKNGGGDTDVSKLIDLVD